MPRRLLQLCSLGLAATLFLGTTCGSPVLGQVVMQNQTRANSDSSGDDELSETILVGLVVVVVAVLVILGIRSDRQWRSEALDVEQMAWLDGEREGDAGAAFDENRERLGLSDTF